MKKLEINGKVAIVAGGTGGIGFEACKLLAGQNASIVIARRKNANTRSKFNNIKELSPSGILMEGDFTEWESWEILIKTVIKKYGKIDYLINCIGTISPISFDKMSVTDIDFNIRTNLISTIYASRAVIPQMLKQKNGHLIIVGSLGGIIPMPFETIYSTTKFAVRGFCLSLAKELKNSGTAVSLISPGPVKTKLLDKEALDDKSTLAFVNKPIHPNDIAESILKIIYKPKLELVLPKSTKRISLIVSNHPKLFSILYPILDLIGKYRQTGYRRKYFLTSLNEIYKVTK